FIEPKTPIVRETEKERNPVHLPWPNRTDPIWTGISALEELRTNTAWPNAPNFADKERDGLPVRDLAADLTTLKLRLGIAQTILSNSVLEKIQREPWLIRFYGRTLPTL